jgi:ketosteroid isomerase-like protein
MSIPNAKQTAENLLTDYAEVLNTANTVAIASFYTFDGLFMPDGYQSIKAYDLAKAGERYLKKHVFHIRFDIQSVSEENGFVFVQANANTILNADQGPEAIQTSSRDFFILRKDDTVWKIYRYIFNKHDQSVVA